MGKSSKKSCPSTYPKGLSKFQWECKFCKSTLYGNTEKHIKLKMKLHEKKCEKAKQFFEDFKKKMIADLIKEKMEENTK